MSMSWEAMVPWSSAKLIREAAEAGLVEFNGCGEPYVPPGKVTEFIEFILMGN